MGLVTPDTLWPLPLQMAHTPVRRPVPVHSEQFALVVSGLFAPSPQPVKTETMARMPRVIVIWFRMEKFIFLISWRYRCAVVGLQAALFGSF